MDFEELRSEVPEEVFELLWFNDGKYKNIGVGEGNASSSFYEASAIYAEYPVSKDVDKDDVESPRYYPNYGNLSSEQRGVYFNYLKDIYDYHYPISYVFLFYYGLERHLYLNDKFDEAFRTIMRLRDAHPNGSFQHYSLCSLVCSAKDHDRTDLFLELLDSYDGSKNFLGSDLILSLYELKIPLTAQLIFSNAKVFNYNKERYIKDYPEEFLEALESEMTERYGDSEVLISDLISEEEFEALERRPHVKYSNPSINDRERTITFITSSDDFVMEMYSLLVSAEEAIKIKI